MKIKNNYVEFTFDEFTTIAINFCQNIQKNPELLDSYDDPKMLVRMNEKNNIEMGYIEDFAFIV